MVQTSFLAVASLLSLFLSWLALSELLRLGNEIKSLTFQLDLVSEKLRSLQNNLSAQDEQARTS